MLDLVALSTSRKNKGIHGIPKDLNIKTETLILISGNTVQTCVARYQLGLFHRNLKIYSPKSKIRLFCALVPTFNIYPSHQAAVLAHVDCL